MAKKIPLFSVVTDTDVPVETLTNGEFLRKVGQKKVYEYAGYCRYNRKYTLQDVSDISRCIYLKKGTLVTIGFEY